MSLLPKIQALAVATDNNYRLSKDEACSRTLALTTSYKLFKSKDH